MINVSHMHMGFPQPAIHKFMTQIVCSHYDQLGDQIRVEAGHDSFEGAWVIGKIFLIRRILHHEGGTIQRHSSKPTPQARAEGFIPTGYLLVEV